jgi:hypothetical protein
VSAADLCYLGAVPPNLTFYQAAVALIPALAFALMFQARYLERDDGKSEELRAGALGALAVLALAFAGEIAALHVLSSGKPSDTSHRIVVQALATLGFSVWVLAVFRALGPHTRKYARVDAVAAVVLIGIGMGVFAWLLAAG